MDEIIPPIHQEPSGDRDDSFRAQVQRNLVAIISLVIAISSFGYNSWRNELTEANRNIRDGGFYLLTELGELQRMVDLGHYRENREHGDPIDGWNHVILIRDMAMLMPLTVRDEADTLHTVWAADWQSIGEDEAGVLRITQQIQATRKAVREELADLG